MSLRTLNFHRAGIVAAVAVAAALAAATPGAGEPPALKAKEAEAKAILAQVDALDLQLNRVGEQLNGAQYELDVVRKRERVTRKRLAVARTQYVIARQRVADRLVALYESDSPSITDAVLGATSLSGILDRLQLVEAAGRLDQHLAHEAASRRNRFATQEAALADERQRQAAAVAAIAAHRKTLDVELVQRRTLLSSIQGEVKRMQAAEAARQARLAAEARARLAAELKARAKAAAEAAARAAAARKAAAQRTVTTTTTTPAAATTQATETTPAAPTTTTTTTTAATTTTPAPAPAPSPTPAVGGHPEAATIALRYLGVPYVFGGATPSGFDCSGLVMYVFAQLGISLPHFAAAQYTFGLPVGRADLQPGDLVFFDALGHVGIYIGGNEFVHAPQTGDVVKISSLSGWYAANYVGARRI